MYYNSEILELMDTITYYIHTQKNRIDFAMMNLIWATTCLASLPSLSSLYGVREMSLYVDHCQLRGHHDR